MSDRVTIQTGARLHFGLLAHRPQTGRHFGGVGLMIDSPGVHLSASVASHDEVISPASIKERVEKIIMKYRQETSQHRSFPTCRVEVHQAIPAHQGLGSGTQLALAVGKALAVLGRSEDRDIHPFELARLVGRGNRSALGIYGFLFGGFLVDGGKKSLEDEDIGAFIARLYFPEEWRMVLITPPHEAGLSGADERAAFHHLPGMPEELTNRLCRIVLMDLLPAVEEKEFASVSESLYEYGQHVGSYFEPIQGGRFASRQMEQLAEALRRQGHLGVGQSSWGPTMFVLEESQTAAVDLVRELQEDPKWSDCKFHIAAALNQGARIKVETE